MTHNPGMQCHARSRIGELLTFLNVRAVFGYFAVVSLLGAIVIATFAIETREHWTARPPLSVFICRPPIALSK